MLEYSRVVDTLVSHRVSARESGTWAIALYELDARRHVLLIDIMQQRGAKIKASVVRIPE